jgi:hypothetical protein
MVTWLEIPEIEARVRAAASVPPDLDLLAELVKAVTSAIGAEMKVRDSGNGWRDFRNDRRESWSVSVVGDEYKATWRPPSSGHRDHTFKSTEEIVWKICGYHNTPAIHRQMVERTKHLPRLGDKARNTAAIRTPKK